MDVKKPQIYIFVCVCVSVCVNAPNWILEFSGRSPLPASSTRYELFEKIFSIWTKQKLACLKSLN